MTNPFRYRPTDPEDDWSDNPLSNALAWASVTFFPHWCHAEDNWTAKLTEYLFTNCPCCMLLRGIIIGIAIASPALLLLIISALWKH